MVFAFSCADDISVVPWCNVPETTNYDDLFLMGDFNSEPNEKELADFCETYKLSNLVKVPTCYKNPIIPSCIHLLTNSGNYKRVLRLKLRFPITISWWLRL